MNKTKIKMKLIKSLLLLLFVTLSVFLGYCTQKEKEDKTPLLALLLSQIASNSSANTVTSPPSSLVYSGTPFTYIRNFAITTATPTVTGTITSCSSSPTIPTGLTLNNTTCSISGTPTTNQTATNYTITASNSKGSTTATISITIKDATCGNGVIEGAETCDDNNTFGGDGCNNTCSGP